MDAPVPLFIGNVNAPSITIGKSGGLLIDNTITPPQASLNGAIIVASGGLPSFDIQTFYGVTAPRLVEGATDAYSRRELRFDASNSNDPSNRNATYGTGGGSGGLGGVLRLGTCTTDGDTADVISEGLVVYGMNSVLGPMNIGNCSIIRIGNESITILDHAAGTPFTQFRVNPNSFIWQSGGFGGAAFQITPSALTWQNVGAPGNVLSINSASATFNSSNATFNSSNATFNSNVSVTAGLVSKNPPRFAVSSVPIINSAVTTITAAMMLAGLIEVGDAGAAFTAVTDTAANILAALPAIERVVGACIPFFIANNSVKALTAITAGAGVTLGTGDNGGILNLTRGRSYIMQFTGIGTPACTLYG
jgi:hypothetical protein